MSCDILHATYDFYTKLPMPKIVKSKNSVQCLTPCYPPGTRIRHPETNKIITNKDHIFCAVSNEKETDECYKITPNVYLSWYNTDVSTFYPTQQDQCKLWLSKLHNIKQYSDVHQVLNNPEVDIPTKMRIRACMQIAFN